MVKAERSADRGSVPGFQLGNLPNTLGVSAPFITGLKKAAQYGQSEIPTDHASPQSQDIGVIVLAGFLRHILIAADGGADALELVGRHRNANTRPADQNTEHRLSILQALRHGLGDRPVLEISAVSPVWIGRDRPAAEARAANSAG